MNDKEQIDNEQAQQIGGVFLQQRSTVVYETEPVQYVSVQRPPKPAVLDIGNNVNAPITSGVDFGIEVGS